MPFQVIVREVKSRPTEPGVSAADQIYEQTVEVLDLSKLISAVNHKPRVRKAKATPQSK